MSAGSLTWSYEQNVTISDDNVNFTKLIGSILYPCLDGSQVGYIDCSPDGTSSILDIGESCKLVSTNGAGAVRNVSSFGEECLDDTSSNTL